MRYFSLSGSNLISSFSGTFQNCHSLIAIPELDTSNTTNFSNMFSSCYKLAAIPNLDTSRGTSHTNMFSSCYSLTTVPLLDTSASQNTSNMFSGCYSLSSVPSLDTSSVTNFSGMFMNCRALTIVPKLKTSLGTNLQMMFYNCYSLTEADFTGYNFTGVSANYAIDFASNIGVLPIVKIGDTFGSTGAPLSYKMFDALSNLVSSSTPLRIKIVKDDGVLPLPTNATTGFGTNQNVYIYVPDALLSAYQANAYWSILGARLKGYSALPS